MFRHCVLYRGESKRERLCVSFREAAASLYKEAVTPPATKCDIKDSFREVMQNQYKGCVFHVQRMMARMRKGTDVLAYPLEEAQSCHKRGLGQYQTALGGILALTVTVNALAQTSDQGCIDYYTIGESKCEASASVQTSSSRAPELVAPQPAPTDEQKVDEFLANYGKPPREFVQFYMNPTPENAQKWVAAYQDIMQKSQNLSQLWADAEKLYSQPDTPAATQRAAPSLGAVSAPKEVSVPVAVPPSVRASGLTNFGALNVVQPVSRSGGFVPQERSLKVTYYFSQVCPFCARMTPELSSITNSYEGKLEFTCVDVTPFSGNVAPNPAYLRDKLACQWRLPQAEELQREGVAQTPTLIIESPGKAPVKLSGYMSPAQLQPYFAR